MNFTKKLPRKKVQTFDSIFLVINAFIWLFFSMAFLEFNVDKVITDSFQTQLIWTVYFTVLITCLITGAMLTNKISSKSLLIFWTMLGVISPVTLLLLDFSRFSSAVVVSVLFAASVGLGMPACMEYFIRSTETSCRGRYGGLIFLISFLGLVVFRLIATGIEITAFILIGWRAIGLLGIFVFKPFNEPEGKITNARFRTILHQKSFLLYLVPWLMFSLVNYLTEPIAISILSQSTFTYMQLIGNTIGFLSAVPAGFLIDTGGRKQAAVAGFVMLGVSYSFLSFFPREIASWYMFTIFEGITWGILSVLFVVCIWGEFNQNVRADKYYAIGILPFLISQFISITLSKYISISSPYALFSFIAFFLFLAVLPLVYAPETLPEKVMKDRELKSYIEKAQKVVAKEQQKKKQKETQHSEAQDASEQNND